MWQRKGIVAVADRSKRIRHVDEMFAHQVDHVAFPLDAPATGEHAGRQDQAALLLEERRPDDEIGDVGLVLDGDEHDALGRTRFLPHQHEARHRHPLAVARRLQGLARAVFVSLELRPQESHGMPAQGETLRSIILHDFTTLGHGRERERPARPIPGAAVARDRPRRRKAAAARRPAP